MNLDTPVVNQKVSEKVEVRGWIISNEKAPLSLSVLVNNKEISSIAVDRRREDVQQFHNLDLKNPLIGFHDTFSLDEIEKKTNSLNKSISIRISLPKKNFIYGPFPIQKVDSRLTARDRGGYKEAWNKEAENQNLAMLSVAGYADFNQFMKSGENTAKTITEALDILKTDSVLEIGCGTGRIGAALASKCQEWIGTDISEKMIEYAHENLKTLDNVRLTELKDVSLKDFQDSSVDKVYCSTVFMHLDEWDRYTYIEEALRILKPGGKAYFDNINLLGDIGWGIFKEMRFYDPADRPTNISKTSTPEELYSYLERAGFINIQSFPGSHYVAVSGSKKLAFRDACR